MNHYCVDFFTAFDIEYEKIKHASTDPITQANALIAFIEKKIKELYKWLKTYSFESDIDEIFFFKELKPKLVSKLLFYQKILKLESDLPLTKELKKKHFEKALNKVYQHSKKHKDFYRYYRSRSSYKDTQYFIRNDEKPMESDNYFQVNFDIQFSTSRDYIVAKIMANDLFSAYLEDKLEKINMACNIQHPLLGSNLNWTGNKIDLVEVVYALHHQKVINGGNIEIKELACHVGQIFNIDLEEYVYRYYTDIKNRKTIKTKFLCQLSDNLSTKMIEEES
jgi:RteC protein